MMVTVFCSPGAACLARGFGAWLGDLPTGAVGRFSAAGAAWADRDAGDRLAAQRIVVEDGKADEGHQKQAEQHGERLGCR